MKKIIILIGIILLTAGCYDNIELDDLAIITSIGIDVEDDLYKVTYEILSDVKTEENMALLSYTISGEGKSISEAFINANYKVSKRSYFAHLKILVLGENILNGELENIIDYLLRDTNIRSEFKVVASNGNTPEEILKNNDDHHPVVSETITNLLDNEKYNNNLIIDDTFKQVASKLISDNSDVIINTVSIKEKNIAINDSYILKGFNYQNTLSKKDSVLYNLLTTNISAMEFDKYYNDKNVTITLTKSDTSINVTKDKIIINTDLEGKILENNALLRLEEVKTYQQLNKDFSEIIKNDIITFIKLLQQNGADILGLQEIYFRNTRKENKDLWLNANIEVNVNLKINTKGFTFEVAK